MCNYLKIPPNPPFSKGGEGGFDLNGFIQYH